MPRLQSVRAFRPRCFRPLTSLFSCSFTWLPALTCPCATVSDSESEFEDEFDTDFYKGPDDKKWLMSLSELEREKVIADRKDKRAIAQEAWQLKQVKKKQDAAAPRGAGRRQVAPDDKKKAAKAALDDMANKKKQAQKKV